ncbi:MAG TPA: SBBP repeat-containing protein [Terriglobales bacterium]|nr:SBBP repeat-containing protein [Terriglobales bacterium]
MRSLVTEKKRRTGNGLTVIFLATALLALAGIVFHFGSSVHTAKAGDSSAIGSQVADRQALAAKSMSLPLVFEPNQGQTAAPVKFVAHGAGYGLFLTSDEAVLALQGAAIGTQHPAFSGQSSALGSQRASNSVLRMRLEGANASASVSGSSPLPGRTSYIIGNNPAKWHRDVPQFGRVEYAGVYRGVDLVYYGNQGQLEYDFRVAPGADPDQIALNFQGATPHILDGDSGDLVLTTAAGEVRFHAPRIYQPAVTAAGESAGSGETEVSGSFRQLAGNKIGFAIGDYDHSRELVIDPTLSYSTYLGGTAGIEGPNGPCPSAPCVASPGNLISVAVDAALNIYLAGSTTSTNFPITTGNNVPAGEQNIFISRIYPLGTGSAQLVYSIILGGTDAAEVDTLAGIVVDLNQNIYVAGSTNSGTFPTNGTNAAFQASPLAAACAAPSCGTHGFLSAFTVSSSAPGYALSYSTYLSGFSSDGTDIVTGLAVDLNQNAYVTGNTTSIVGSSNGFPANPNGYQTNSNSPGNPQFFASKISTTDTGTGSTSMIYSTYFGGGYPSVGIANGGGVAVDLGGNMYITGTTNMQSQVPSSSSVLPFPLLNEQQNCLNQAVSVASCSAQTPTTITDGYVAKINPNLDGPQSLVYSTYIGGSGSDAGNAIAVDTSGNAFVAGSTNSTDWNFTLQNGFQPAYAGTQPNSNAYVVELVNSNGLSFPINYFTYLGGSGPDSALGIQVDSVDGVHVAGYTESPNFPSLNPLSVAGGNCAGASPSVPYAFVALIETSLPGQAAGDYSTCLGGSQFTQGTGVAIDNLAATYVAGTTQAANYPLMNPYQPQLNGTQNAFVSRLAGQSTLTMPVTVSPTPVNAGQQATFAFTITNSAGGDNANDVTFIATVPSTGLLNTPQALVAGGLGTCNQVVGTTIICNIPTLAAGSSAQVEVEVTANATTFPPVLALTVSGTAGANGSTNQVSNSATVKVVDFTVSCSTTTPIISAGDTAAIQVVFAPAAQNGSAPYIATITPSDTISPSMVTSPTPTFNPINVPMTGQTSGSTTLSIGTVARPVNSGSLRRRGSFYATWLPISGISLIGLGIGAGRKRRRWLMGAVLGLVAGAILLLPSCGSNSNVATSTGGTLAGTYIVTIEGSAGTGSSHSCEVNLTVN